MSAKKRTTKFARIPVLTRRILDVICPVPDEASALRSESGWLRWSHADIAAMTREQQRRELFRTGQRLTIEENPTDPVLAWLTERVRLLRETLGERNAAA